MNTCRLPLPIRPAAAGDHPGIVRVWQESGLSYREAGRDALAAFTRQLAAFPESYLVAADGDRIAGVILGTHDHRKGWINRLAVLPACRRCGLASRLLRACEAALARHGIEIVTALVEPDNAGSMAFFASQGYAVHPAHYYRKLSRPDI